MLTIPFFAKGFVIGLILSIPVGPIAILCIRKSLTNGRLHGIFTGLGAAFADALYGYIAAFGLSFVDDFLLNHQDLLRIIAGIFLGYLGLHLYRSQTVATPLNNRPRGLLTTFASAFFITMSNPGTLVALAIILASFGIEETVSPSAGALLIAGIFIGSALWWFVLTNIAYYLRSKITLTVLQRINKISGCFLIACGLFIIISTLLSSH